MALPDAVPHLRHGPVVLRAFEERDADLVVSAASDDLIPWITTVPTSGSRRDAVEYIARQHSRLQSGAGYPFAIANSETDEAVGQIGLWLRDIDEARATMGYWIGLGYRRRGYLTAALGALTDWALQLDEVERLQLFVEPCNEGSWRAAERCGYQREGLLRSWQQVGSLRKDMYVYSVVSGASSQGRRPAGSRSGRRSTSTRPGPGSGVRVSGTDLHRA
ncbi:MAG: GNAT family N-acetyltransferase [Pseudonocardia sp.]|nr:GNAT family N-acetyltransferase [Pseudonocardia sp.]